MARITLAPLATTASGRVGGLVLRQTRFGTVAQSAAPARVYDTAPALLSKARFRAAQKTWATMHEPLKVGLIAEQKRRSIGTPGPWFTAWMTYVRGGPWNYSAVTNSAQTLIITSVTDLGPAWRLNLTTQLTAGWTHAWLIVFHPELGPQPVWPSYWPTIAGGFADVSKTLVLPGSSALLLPSLDTNPGTVGLGDAHSLP